MYDRTFLIYTNVCLIFRLTLHKIGNYYYLSTKRKMKRLLWLIGIPISIILVWVIFIVVRCWPGNERQLTSSLVTMKRVSYFTLLSNHSPILYFSSLRDDSLMEHPAWNKDSIITSTQMYHGFWIKPSWLFPVCKGRMVAAIDSVKTVYNEQETVLIVKKEINRLQKKLRDLDAQRDEYRYYLKVHSVKDEGYELVAKHATINHSRMDTIQHVLRLLSAHVSNKKLKINRIDQYHAYIRHSQKSASIECSLVRYGTKGQIALMQTIDKKTPKDVFAISIIPYASMFWQGVLSLSSRDSLPVPTALGECGAPIFTKYGNMVGMKLNKGGVDSKDILK